MFCHISYIVLVVSYSKMLSGCALIKGLRLPHKCDAKNRPLCTFSSTDLNCQVWTTFVTKVFLALSQTMWAPLLGILRYNIMGNDWIGPWAILPPPPELDEALETLPLFSQISPLESFVSGLPNRIG